MKRVIACLTLISLMLTGCSTFGTNTPSSTAAQEAQLQHAAAIAALEGYCSVVTLSDSEVKKVCDSVLPIAQASQTAVSVALGLIVNILTKREMRSRAMLREAAECHD